MKHGRVALAAGILTLAAAGTAVAWGFHGHGIIGRAAVETLPADMPEFFTDAAAQLAYLNPEPDRWRSDDRTAMNEAFSYDHYIDLENVADGALDAGSRWEYLARLYDAGLENPHQAAGFLPYRIHELYQRLATGFARWRQAGSDEERVWIEARIINDAGVLGHYVADGANPHHSTIHFNGWAESEPNPEGYTTSRDFHWRFESEFVSAHIGYDEVRAALTGEAEARSDMWAAILAYIQDSNDRVVELYELEKAHGFDPERATPETEAFAIERMAAGAAMLRDVWYSAWVESASLETPRY